ncbi:peptide deformylase [Chryseosolibacter indicus]|uniref:Peptide deformylase n=1 Tax=Chryseosolibacter indicus TaxID=2782351 RepID=A0ABS5VWL6_9BACT|nr:peptide deformylase [Chryseosolibacter indicus]MBT1705813.1 peptide deformylase [Chryseosolibacter indicus]
MIRSIVAYGNPILRKQCVHVIEDLFHLQQLIDDMWETMYNADGCGLAAPQVGHSLRLFIVDSKTTYNNLDPEDRTSFFEEGDTGIIETFINAEIIERSERLWEDDEGCLSIPGISQTVTRPWSITVRYLDRDLQKHQKTFTGLTARMIQHEYDHTQGILYVDYLKPLTRKLLEGKLKKIVKGLVKVKYPIE